MNLVKTNYSVIDEIRSIYSGGKIQSSKDGDSFLCLCAGILKVISCQNSREIRSFFEEDDPITHFCLSPDNQILITAHNSLAIRHWDWDSARLNKMWRSGHKSAIRCIEFDHSSTLVCSGGDDKVIKVWNSQQFYCTNTFKGHSSPITICRFFHQLLFSVSLDGVIFVWDLTESKKVTQISLHTAHVTDCVFYRSYFCSVSNDCTMAVFDLSSLTLVKSLATDEEMQAVVGTDKGLLTVSSKGNVILWDVEKSTIRSKYEIPIEDFSLTSFQLFANDGYLATTSQNNVIMLDYEFKVFKQIPGDYEGVVSVVFVGADCSHLVVASSTASSLRLCGLYNGKSHFFTRHNSPLICATASHDRKRVASASQDGMVVVWMFEDESLKVESVATGHTSAVNVLTFAYDGSFVMSGSASDCHVKIWPFGKQVLSCKRTVETHKKTLTDLVVSPNDSFFATCSRDKLIKLWSVKTFDLVSVLKGHRKAVLCISFSPVDKVLASSSTDGVIFIWSLTTYSVIKTLEGSQESVYNVKFISKGTQLISSCADGLLRLWLVKTSECVKTLEDHKDRVYSLDFNVDESRLVSAGENSVIYLWRDTSEDDRIQELTENRELMTKKQILENFLNFGNLAEALPLTLELDRPHALLTIIQKLYKLSNIAGSIKTLKKSFSQLPPSGIEKLLEFCVVWNGNSRTCFEAQLALSALLRAYEPEKLMKQVININPILEGLIGFQERHFARISSLVNQTGFLDFIGANFIGLRVDSSATTKNNLIEDDCAYFMNTSQPKKFKVENTEGSSDLSVLIRNSIGNK